MICVWPITGLGLSVELELELDVRVNVWLSSNIAFHPPPRLQLNDLHLHNDVATIAGRCARSTARRVGAFFVLCDETDRGRHNVLFDLLVAGQHDLGVPGLMSRFDCRQFHALQPRRQRRFKRAAASSVLFS
jgi:hypothetical protein